jgi:hypothetical protein
MTRDDLIADGWTFNGECKVCTQKYWVYLKDNMEIKYGQKKDYFKLYKNGQQMAYGAKYLLRNKIALFS